MTESWDAQKVADEVWDQLGGKPGTWNNIIVTALQTALQAAFDAGHAAGAAQERERCAEWVQSMVDAALRAAPPTPNP